jgi:hypothetical protein
MAMAVVMAVYLEVLLCDVWRPSGHSTHGTCALRGRWVVFYKDALAYKAHLLYKDNWRVWARMRTAGYSQG